MANSSNTTDPDGKRADWLTILGLNRADASQGMSWAAVDNFIRQSKDMLYANRWHRAQVDAKQRQRYKACGDEEVYQPPEYPEEGDDEVSGSFFNNTIISDRAASVLADALKGDINVEQPPQPIRQPAPWWRIFLATILSILIGAILVFLAWKMFGDQPRYEIIAEPFEPPTLLEFEK